MSGLAAKGLAYAFTRLHHGENELAKELLAVAERHRTHHEIHHVARDLAAWSSASVTQIAAVAADHDLHLATEADEPSRLTHIGAKLASLAGRRPEPALLLLEDLRTLYLMGSENSLAWEMLAQLAQATHRRDILHLASDCHPQTLRQIRWANTMIKTLSPQALSSL
jgi:hypothetical protein